MPRAAIHFKDKKDGSGLGVWISFHDDKNKMIHGKFKLSLAQLLAISFYERIGKIIDGKLGPSSLGDLDGNLFDRIRSQASEEDPSKKPADDKPRE